MYKKTLLATLIMVTMFAIIISCNNAETKKETVNTASNNDELIKRGSYLVSIMGCDDCHSPKKMTAQGPVVDMDKRFSGYPSDRPFAKVDSNIIKNGMAIFTGDLMAAAGPWGVTFSANISSDETGIGNWSLDHFKKALREGKWKGMDGSRTLLPPMPWQNYKNLTDDDISAIFTFLKATKPMKNIEPSPKQLSDL